MSDLWRGVENRGIRKGRAEGLAEGRAEGLATGSCRRARRRKAERNQKLDEEAELYDGTGDECAGHAGK